MDEKPNKRTGPDPIIIDNVVGGGTVKFRHLPIEEQKAKVDQLRIAFNEILGGGEDGGTLDEGYDSFYMAWFKRTSLVDEIEGFDQMPMELQEMLTHMLAKIDTAQSLGGTLSMDHLSALQSAVQNTLVIMARTMHAALQEHNAKSEFQ